MKFHRTGAAVCTNGKLPTLVRGTLLVMALAVANTATAAKPGWPTTAWGVLCTAATLQVLSAEDCDDQSLQGPATVARDQLEQASVWLQNLGFKAPAIELDKDLQDTPVYLAWIDDASPYKKRDKEPWGYYDGSTLYLNSGYFFALGESEAELALDSRHMVAPTHELFHAIQSAYDSSVAFSRNHAWLIEGSATAVMFAWLRRLGVQASAHSRYYDRPLHKPLCGRVAGTTEYGCYATQQFWTWLGRKVNSQDAIAYLDQVFQQDLGASAGLQGVDAALKQWHKQGLYHFYPQFIAEAATTADLFEQVRDIKLSYAESEVKKTVAGTVPGMTAQAYQLAVHIPPGKDAILKVEFRNDNDALHLIVNGKRADKQGNTFSALLHGNAKFFIRVANVARQAAESKNQNYELQLSLVPDKGAACTFRATVEVEPIGTYRYFIRDGKKTLIQRTEVLEGKATISDNFQKLALVTKDSESGSADSLFVVDIAPLGIGGPPGPASTRGDVGYQISSSNPYSVELNIEENADPGNVASWSDMTVQEQLESGLGYPNRLAMRRLRGEFSAKPTKTPECCVSYIKSIHAVFDAGNGPYHCEGGLEMQKKAWEKGMKKVMKMLGDDPDPGKLDGLFD